ncbi:MAG: quinone-dependent dihydroorotate dehydrogenase [Pseudomonadota bacterium]
MLYDVSRAVLFRMDPERAHDITLSALERGVYPRGKPKRAPALETRILDCVLPNPIGVAAGFDKDARVPDALLGMGFGFAEVGTLTPRPQAGNAKPRVFRLIQDNAIINRNGFNNAGHDVALARLSARQRSGCVGVNLGANKDSKDRIADYVQGVETFYDHASYFMINVSSPNTPGLRDLQAPDAIGALFDAVNDTRDRLADRKGRRVSIAVKLAPDLADADIRPIIDALLARNVGAIAISNTTIARPDGLKSEHKLIDEVGGLSGDPLFDRSTAVLAQVYAHVGRSVPLIGIGGIRTGASAIAKIKAGATAIQIYTGLVFGGHEVLSNIEDAFSRAVNEAGVNRLADLIGRAHSDWL